METVVALVVALYLIIWFFTARYIFPIDLEKWSYGSIDHTDVSFAFTTAFFCGAFFPIYWILKIIGWSFMDYAKKVMK